MLRSNANGTSDTIWVGFQGPDSWGWHQHRFDDSRWTRLPEIAWLPLPSILASKVWYSRLRRLYPPGFPTVRNLFPGRHLATQLLYRLRSGSVSHPCQRRQPSAMSKVPKAQEAQLSPQSALPARRQAGASGNLSWYVRSPAESDRNALGGCLLWSEQPGSTIIVL